jgi:hypothetical protein
MLNQKTIRAGLPAGELTKRDVFNAFPFDSRLVTVNMKASEVAEIYNDSMDRLDQTSLTAGGRFAIYHNREKHANAMLENVPRQEFESDPSRFGPPLGALEDYADTIACEVNPERELKVGTSDYLVSGGLHYFKAGAASIVRDLGPLREVVQGYIEHNAL